MGIFHSKVDVAGIEAIEFNVSDLIIRLSEEEVKIDDFVKHRISKALFAYSNLIEREKKKGFISKRKMQKMKDLVSQARSKLERLSTIRCTHDNTERKSLLQMRTELFEIEKRLNSDRIKQDEYEYFLNIVTMYSQNLELNSGISMTQEEDDKISVLVLKLFLKSPLVKTSNVLQNILRNLDGAVEYFEVFGTNSVTVFNAEEVKKHLEEIKRKIGIVNQGVNNLDQEVKTKGVILMKEDSNKSFSYAAKLVNTNFSSPRSSKEETIDDTQISRYENILKQVESDLYEYDTIVDKFCSPIGDAAVDNVKQKLANLLNNYLKIVPEGGELRFRKKVLLDKGTQIVAKLDKINEENKKINENLKVLAEVEDKLSTIVESNFSFQEKRISLETLAQIAKGMNTNNNEVIMQKTEVINRIEGCLIVESMIYLRQLKKTVDNYKIYAQQFAYPRSINLYEVKTAEIRLLKKHLCDVPRGNQSIEKRVKYLLQQVDEVLEILDSKVNDNEEKLFVLKDLEYIATEINHQDQGLNSRLERLQTFNNFRKRLNSIASDVYRVSSKKMEIRRQLHALEANIYSKKYPEELQEMKTILNEHEKRAQQLKLPSSEENNEQRREILSLWEKTKIVMGEKYIGYDNIYVINENFELVLELMKKVGKEIKDSTDRIQSLEIMKTEVLGLSSERVPISMKLELLIQKEGLITLMRKTSVCKAEASTMFEDIEKLIAVEKFKIQLPQSRAALAKFAEVVTHPMDTDFYIHQLNEILDLKEHIEDIPECNAELDCMKQSFAQEVFNSLNKLDEFLGSLVKNRKQPENILDLQSHFNDFNLDTMKIGRESVEFVRMIRQRAETFEKCVKYYLGTDYSVDYYVIHENLMRLLEELDRLSCEDVVWLNIIIDTIGYIKNLIEQLDSNASSE